MPSVSRNFQQCFVLYLLLWNFKCASAPPVIAPVVHESESNLHYWIVLHLLLLAAIMATTIMVRRGASGASSHSSDGGAATDDSFLSQEQQSQADEAGRDFADSCLHSRSDADIAAEAYMLAASASMCFTQEHAADDLCAMFRCEGRTVDDKACRKRSEGCHGKRGLICPVHATHSTFIKCANGCDCYIHVGCFWKSSKAIEADNVSWNCGHCLSSVTPVAPLKGASVTPKIEGTIESQPNDSCTFEDSKSLSDALRLQGFTKLTNHKNLAGTKVSYIFVCSVCDARFTAKKGKDADGSWYADPALHTATCLHNPANQKESSETKHIMKQHEFAKKKGLLEYIEILGACGEVRADQLARAIAKKFDGTIVEPNLLFRTATKAKESVFGKSTSDVLALQELSQRIIDGDGVCEFVYGISFCGVDTQIAHF
jgi:hypothetical protein